MPAKEQDIQRLFRSTKSKTLVVHWDGEDWTFKYRTPSWAAYLKNMESAWYEDSGGESHFNLEQYYTDMILEMFTEFPGNIAPTKTTLNMFDPQVFVKLMTVVPKPGLTDAADEVKKEPVTPSTDVQEDDSSATVS